ncbi:AbrB/MazE/SpoVT family DNA-binding domain-containing protein [Rhodoferax sp. 4810]|nr:AbrB/MazE/SpoVT family DNA-binding domain-containing protein [Rhodoferax jenense]
MLQIQTKLTSQGQVSVPAAIRNLLNLTPGSILLWKEEAGRVSVERSVRHSTAEVNQALFGDAPAAPATAKTPAELKQGIRQLMKRRHAGG